MGVEISVIEETLYVKQIRERKKMDLMATLPT